MDTSRLDAVYAGTGFAEDGPGFPYWRLPLDYRAFQIGDAEVGLRKFRQQVVQQGVNISVQEMGAVALNGADVGSNQDTGHSRSLILDQEPLFFRFKERNQSTDGLTRSRASQSCRRPIAQSGVRFR